MANLTTVPGTVVAIDEQKLSSIDKWILKELDTATEEIDKSLEAFRFNEAANAVYHFFWGSFCDWYLELVKPVLMGKESPERKATVQGVLVYVLEQSMRLLHPFMPFITEEIWQMIQTAPLRKKGDRQEVSQQQKGDRQEILPSTTTASLPVPFLETKTIMLSTWPTPRFEGKFAQEAKQVQVFQDAVIGIRDLRTRLGLKPSEKLNFVQVTIRNDEMREFLNKSKDYKSAIAHLCQVEVIEIATEGHKKPGMISKIYGYMEIFVAGLSPDLLKIEEDRTKKKIAELEGVVRGIDSRLSDSKFVSSAPEEVVEKERLRKEDFTKQLSAYRENLALFKQS
ncbi:MAG: class I tRNA ligase family protein [Candidatus Omnitrophica bacterium]|nr:class I tRNA ligase family protein [Candidatus Omnitrophota bacterium]